MGDPLCDPNGDGYEVPPIAGHGTHVAGLIAANGSSSNPIYGTCERCGVAMWRIVHTRCTNGVFYLTQNNTPYHASLALLAQQGSQIISVSLASSAYPGNYCDLHPKEVFCLAITYADERGVALVASSGNWRNDIYFPAKDFRVIAAGGVQEDLTLWDESPNMGTANCPLGSDQECGSNYSKTTTVYKQELVASAHHVLSTIYTDEQWFPEVLCGDDYGTPNGDGIGWCTGTSMAAP